MDTPRLLGIYICRAIQRKLQMTEAQVYEAAVQGFVEGQPPSVVQVVPGATQTEGGGHGAQEGGAILRRQTYKLVYWHTAKMDPHGWTQQALVEADNGILDFMEGLRKLFALTTFGGLTYEVLRYEGESDTFIFDEDRGILYRILTISAPYGESLPTTESVTLADVL